MIAWREGTNTELNSRFAAVRLRPASRDYNRPEAHAQEWLLIEWPEGEVEPSKYWLSTLPADATITQLVDTAKLRWRIERDYQELKQELGLGHYEGRGWRGFHHHASLCIAAYGFLIALRETIPPLYGAMIVKPDLGSFPISLFGRLATISSSRPSFAMVAPRAVTVKGGAAGLPSRSNLSLTVTSTAAD